MVSAKAKGTRRGRYRKEVYPFRPEREDMAEQRGEVSNGDAIDYATRVGKEARAEPIRQDRDGHEEITPGPRMSVGSSYEDLANMDYVVLHRTCRERMVVGEGISEEARSDGQE